MSHSHILFPPKNKKEGNPPQYKISISITLEPDSFQFKFEGGYGFNFPEFNPPFNFADVRGETECPENQYATYASDLKIIEESVIDPYIRKEEYSVFEIDLQIIYKIGERENYIVKKQNITCQEALTLYAEWKNQVSADLNFKLQSMPTPTCVSRCRIL